MKLFTRYNRINIFATVIIFLLASVAFAFLLRYVLTDQLDDYLRVEQREIEAYFEKYRRLPETMPVKDLQIAYTPVNNAMVKRSFTTVKLFDPVAKDEDWMRQLAFGMHVNGQSYKVTVSKSMEGTEDLVQSILVITTSTILLILVVSFLINRLVLRKLWKPFYQTLESMKDFKLGQKHVPEFAPSNIDEFAFMNLVMLETTGKAEQDYKLLKEFTENASHELQTPLAIIRSKLDLLIQDEDITEPQSRAVQSAYDAIQKMSRLNQSLLLLSKIENHQFSETTLINLEEKLKEKQEQFRELWEGQKLEVSLVTSDVQLYMNNELADILLNNLFSNATRHNMPGGQIDIELKPGHLKIINTGRVTPLQNNRLFTRFYKPEPSKDTNGLGLSIIKQICNMSGYTVCYDFNEGRHSFGIFFQ